MNINQYEVNVPATAITISSIEAIDFVVNVALRELGMADAPYRITEAGMLERVDVSTGEGTPVREATDLDRAAFILLGHLVRNADQMKAEVSKAEVSKAVE